MRLSLLLLAFVSGCGGCEEEKPVAAERPKIDWLTTNFGHLRLAIPRSWTKNPQRRGGNQAIFLSPVKRQDFQQNLMVIWQKSKLGVDAWANLNRGKFDDPRGAYKVHEQGWTKIGGQRAYLMVHEHEEGDPKRGKAPFVSIDWYFAYEGHVGFLRGNSRKELFEIDRPLYEESASLLRFGPIK